ncbi:hypothetical protein [Bradyrhizobium elkanii]|uniref:hypothetical protein n=1 Tax=Bradyrhizobium elkanii TaxID=29448 RepID=UPI00351792B3
MAAGGTVLALSAIAPASSATAPAASPDPVFGLIEAHRSASRILSSAVDERGRRARTLLAEGIGLHPFFVAVDFRGSPIVFYTHTQIDACPDLERPDQAHAGLDLAIGRHSAIVGDIDSVVGDASDVVDERFDALISAAPTSAQGLRALLSYILRDDDAPTSMDLAEDCCRIETLMRSIEGALDHIAPVGARETI